MNFLKRMYAGRRRFKAAFLIGVIVNSLALANSAAPGGIPVKHRFILADEGAQQVLLIDENRAPNLVWKTATPGNNRDLQLIGNNRILVSRQAGGYWEISIADGKIEKECITNFGETHAARRLPNGNTVLAGDNLNGGNGITLVEIDSNKTIKRQVSIPNTNSCRVVRRTWKETFLVGATDMVYEINWAGTILWQQKLQLSNYGGYMPLRQRGGNTLVACGYVPIVQEYSPAGAIVRTIGGTTQPNATAIHPYFYAGFQVQRNGQLFIANWQGHGATHGSEGIQVLQYNAAGTVVWSWKDTSANPCYSSIHHIIVLDSLNTQLMYDDVNGFMYPVFGCTDAKAPNYDSLVIADDGSCRPVVAAESYSPLPPHQDFRVTMERSGISVFFPVTGTYTVKLYSIRGKLIFTAFVGNGDRFVIPRTSSMSGMLILDCRGENGLSCKTYHLLSALTNSNNGNGR